MKKEHKPSLHTQKCQSNLLLEPLVSTGSQRAWFSFACIVSVSKIIHNFILKYFFTSSGYCIMFGLSCHMKVRYFYLNCQPEPMTWLVNMPKFLNPNRAYFYKFIYLICQLANLFNNNKKLQLWECCRKAT